MTRWIAIANQKGGVGKTTTTLNLGAALQERGRSVVLVDLDPQASLTLALCGQPGAQGDPLEPGALTLYSGLMKVLQGEAAPMAAIARDTAARLPLMPASIELSSAEMDLAREPLGLYALRDGLATLPPTYDFGLIDCPPSLGLLTTNALAAASEVLIPLQADYLALRGVELLLNTVGKIQKRVNPDLRVLGIVLTLADLRTLHAREVVTAARTTFSSRVPVLEPVIPYSVRVKEAPLANRSVLEYAQDTPAALAYRHLAELIDQSS